MPVVKCSACLVNNAIDEACCPTCSHVFYCSEACRTLDWESLGHRELCPGVEGSVTQKRMKMNLRATQVIQKARFGQSIDADRPWIKEATAYYQSEAERLVERMPAFPEQLEAFIREAPKGALDAVPRERIEGMVEQAYAAAEFLTEQMKLRLQNLHQCTDAQVSDTEMARRIELFSLGEQLRDCTIAYQMNTRDYQQLWGGDGGLGNPYDDESLALFPGAAELIHFMCVRVKAAMDRNNDIEEVARRVTNDLVHPHTSPNVEEVKDDTSRRAFWATQSRTAVRPRRNSLVHPPPPPSPDEASKPSPLMEIVQDQSNLLVKNAEKISALMTIVAAPVKFGGELALSSFIKYWWTIHSYKSVIGFVSRDALKALPEVPTLDAETPATVRKARLNKYIEDTHKFMENYPGIVFMFALVHSSIASMADFLPVLGVRWVMGGLENVFTPAPPPPSLGEKMEKELSQKLLELNPGLEEAYKNSSQILKLVDHYRPFNLDEHAKQSIALAESYKVLENLPVHGNPAQTVGDAMGASGPKIVEALNTLHTTFPMVRTHEMLEQARATMASNEDTLVARLAEEIYGRTVPFFSETSWRIFIYLARLNRVFNLYAVVEETLMQAGMASIPTNTGPLGMAAAVIQLWGYSRTVRSIHVAWRMFAISNSMLDHYALQIPLVRKDRGKMRPTREAGVYGLRGSVLRRLWWRYQLVSRAPIDHFRAFERGAIIRLTEKDDPYSLDMRPSIRVVQKALWGPMLTLAENTLGTVVTLTPILGPPLLTYGIAFIHKLHDRLSWFGSLFSDDPGFGNTTVPTPPLQVSSDPDPFKIKMWKWYYNTSRTWGFDSFNAVQAIEPMFDPTNTSLLYTFLAYGAKTMAVVVGLAFALSMFEWTDKKLWNIPSGTLKLLGKGGVLLFGLFNRLFSTLFGDVEETDDNSFGMAAVTFFRYALAVYVIYWIIMAVFDL